MLKILFRACFSSSLEVLLENGGIKPDCLTDQLSSALLDNTQIMFSQCRFSFSPTPLQATQLLVSPNSQIEEICKGKEGFLIFLEHHVCYKDNIKEQISLVS